MLDRRRLTVSVLLFSCLVASGKDKKKILLPSDVLQAHTVLVMVDPDAGVDLQDPNANLAARNGVENAFVKWGRLTPVPGGSKADLIIVVRKGSGKVAQPTIGGTPANNTPPVIAHSTDSAILVAGGAGHVRIIDPSDAQAGAGTPDAAPPSSGPRPQVEVGSTQDMLVVYRGRPDPLDAPPVWRYTAKDALRSPDVPAVEAFRKLFDESEKQLASHP